MRQWEKFGVAVLCVAGIASAASAVQPSSPVPASRRAPQAKPPKPVMHRLLGTVISYGTSGAALPGGFYILDTVSVNCGNAAGCTIENLMANQVGVNTTAGNKWAICGKVDDFYMNPGCPYQGTIPTDSTYVSGFAGQSYTVAQGKHKLQTVTYTAAAATQGNWQTTYNIYAP